MWWISRCGITWKFGINVVFSNLHECRKCSSSVNQLASVLTRSHANVSLLFWMLHPWSDYWRIEPHGCRYDSPSFLVNEEKSELVILTSKAQLDLAVVSVSERAVQRIDSVVPPDQSVLEFVRLSAAFLIIFEYSWQYRISFMSLERGQNERGHFHQGQCWGKGLVVIGLQQMMHVQLGYLLWCRFAGFLWQTQSFSMSWSLLRPSCVWLWHVCRCV